MEVYLEKVWETFPDYYYSTGDSIKSGSQNSGMEVNMHTLVHFQYITSPIKYSSIDNQIICQKGLGVQYTWPTHKHRGHLLSALIDTLSHNT